jgi:putative ABC transport system substrate-binding protein
VTNQRRRRFLQGWLGLVAIGLLAGCGSLPIPGQRPANARRIGYLDAATNTPALRALREGLRDLDYVDGQNILIDHRDAQGDLALLPELAAALVDSPVEAIVVTNNSAATAASHATSTIPIVAAGANVVAAGLVASIARPEGNITGVTTNSVELVGKWLEVLKEAVPRIARLAAVLDFRGPPAQAFLPEVQRAAQALHLELRSYDLRSLDDLGAVLSLASADGADGLVMVSGGVIAGGTDPRIGGEVLRARLPAVAEQRDFAVAGGLLAHGVDTLALVRRAASYVDKILKGAKPGDLPIELPTTFSLVVNLNTARNFGITVPQSVLLRATEVIQ